MRSVSCEQDKNYPVWVNILKSIKKIFEESFLLVKEIDIHQWVCKSKLWIFICVTRSVITQLFWVKIPHLMRLSGIAWAGFWRIPNSKVIWRQVAVWRIVVWSQYGVSRIRRSAHDWIASDQWKWVGLKRASPHNHRLNFLPKKYPGQHMCDRGSADSDNWKKVFFLNFCQTIADRKVLHQPTLDHQTLAFSGPEKIKLALIHVMGERERLFGSREREVKLKIIFPFYGKGTSI